VSTELLPPSQRRRSNWPSREPWRRPRWRCWCRQRHQDPQTPAAGVGHSSALTEASDPQRKAVWFTLRRSRPGSIGRPRYWRDSRQIGLPAPDGLQRDAQGGEVEDKPINSGHAMATREACQCRARGRPRASHEGLITTMLRNVRKGLGALRCSTKRAAQLKQRQHQNQCQLEGLASRADRQPQHQPEAAQPGTGHSIAAESRPSTTPRPSRDIAASSKGSRCRSIQALDLSRWLDPPSGLPRPASRRWGRPQTSMGGPIGVRWDRKNPWPPSQNQ